MTGSGDHLMVNDANVVCGGIQTANATVYLIDTVLLPPSRWVGGRARRLLPGRPGRDTTQHLPAGRGDVPLLHATPAGFSSCGYLRRRRGPQGSMRQCPPHFCGSAGTCVWPTCRHCWKPPPGNSAVLACFVLDPGWRRPADSAGCSSSATRFGDRHRTRRAATDHPRKPGTARPADLPGGRSERRAHFRRFQPVRGAARRRGRRGTGRRAREPRRDGLAVPGLPGRVTKDDGSPYKVFTRSSPVGGRWAGAPRPVRSGGGRLGRSRWSARTPGPGRCAEPGITLEMPAGEAAAHQRWAEFLAEAIGGYSADRDRPDKPGTSRMSAHLKFGTIHPGPLWQTSIRTNRVRPPISGNWPSGTSTPRCCTSGRPARGTTGTRPSTPSRSTPTPTRGPRSSSGNRDVPAIRSSMRGCASSARPASCTTGCE